MDGGEMWSNIVVERKLPRHIYVLTEIQPARQSLDLVQSYPDLPCILGEGKMCGISGETVNRGIVDINLYIKLVFKRKERGTVYLGR